MRRTITLAVLCLAGALLNIIINKFLIFTEALSLLYMDTIFTVALTFTGGLFWGALCGALTNLIEQTIFPWGWQGYLYAICSVATALITWLFIRFFPRELDLHAKHEELYHTPESNPRSVNLAKKINCTIILLLLSLALCLAMSVLGGLITAFIIAMNPSLSGAWGVSGIRILSGAMFQENYPILLVEISSRIPVNIIDRPIAAYGGYGIAVLLRKIMRELFA